MTQRLDRFLESDCFYMPKGWEQYTLGDYKQHLCVFCDENHAHVAVFKRSNFEINKPINTGANACIECGQHLDAYYVREFKMSSQFDFELDSSDETTRHLYNYEREEPTRTDGFEKYQMISHYMGFDEDVYKYYIHLRPTRDLYVKGSEPNSCYFCDRVNLYGTKWHTINVPVSQQDKLDGGKIYICPTHEKQYQEELNNIYSEAEYNRVIYQHECPSCLESYYVYHSEHTYRKTLKDQIASPVRFLCPACAYETLDQASEMLNGPMFNETAAYPRSEPINRLLLKPCFTCSSGFRLDYMLSLSDMARIHSLGKNRYICAHCSSIGNKNIVLNTFGFDNKIRFRVNEKNGTSDVFAFASTGEAKEIVTLNLYSTELEDQIIETFDAIRRLKNDPDLWPQ